MAGLPPITINGVKYAQSFVNGTLTWSIYQEPEKEPNQKEFNFSETTTPVSNPRCSFCDQEFSRFNLNICSGNEGQEYHSWTVCYGEICQSAEQICRQWLETGGINESESLRSDAYRVAKKRYDDAHKRY